MTSSTGNVADCRLFNFVVWGLCGGVLCAFGFVGNTLSVVALQRDLRSATTTLLQALAVSDLVLLVSVALTDATPYICDFTTKCINPWRSWPHIRYVWLLTPVAHMCSIWLVVLVATNRYWAVCRPHAVNSIWASRRTFFYVIGTATLVIAFNAPRIFEYRMELVSFRRLPVTSSATDVVFNFTAIPTSSAFFETDTGPSVYSAVNDDATRSWTEVDDIIPSLQDTPASQLERHNATSDDDNGHVWRVREVTSQLGRTYAYRIMYKAIFVSLVLVLLPLVALVLFSVLIIRTLRQTPSYRMSQMQKQKRPISAASASIVAAEKVEKADIVASNGLSAEALETGDQLVLAEPIERQLKSPVKQTKSTSCRDSRVSAGAASREITFVLITVVLVAVVCQTPLAVFHCVRYVTPGYECGDVVFYLEVAAKLLVIINSCANFVVYCLLSPKFRRRLLEAITCRPLPARPGSAYGASVTGGGTLARCQNAAKL